MSKKYLMLEKDDMRYEFFSRPVEVSNVDNSIAYYQPVVRCCTRLVHGSTYTERNVTAEYGNNLYKELIGKGFSKVTKRSFV